MKYVILEIFYDTISIYINHQLYFCILALRNWKQIKTTIPFIIASKNEIFSINLAKYMQDLHTDNS